MMENFDCCLYFSVAKLSRSITKMAEDSFSTTGLSPTYAFLLMVVNEKNGISPKDLSAALHITPSTVTRFLDKLELKGYLDRTTEGKGCRISLTQKGKDAQAVIAKAWDDLYQQYSSILGAEEAERIVKITNEVAKKLES